ncbi:ROK family protein [Clavibacter michiganensis]|uniref:ROK family protein n=1 Tax=Clavibacter michiganensis TaxID=28447 RepID=UPI0015E1C296|nr:ROK family protein [Clavibacter michiganensis]
MSRGQADPASPSPSLPSARPCAVVAVDIGGTTLKGAVLDADGRVVARRVTPTFDARMDALVTLRELVADLVARSAARGIRVTAVGLASPGLVDAETGSIGYAANLGWSELPLRRILEDELGLPVHVEHDGRAAAIAERAAHPDEAAAFRDFVFLPIGTGIAAAVVTSGVVVRGATGGAGELGHAPIVQDGDACGCGQRGCLEAYASATSILARYRRRGGTAASSTPGIVARLDVDPDARAVWADAVDALAVGITTLAVVLDPARVVIGGGLSGAGDALLVPLRAAVDARLGWRPAPPITASALGTHGGVVGAALLAGGDAMSPGFALRAAASLRASTDADGGAAVEPAAVPVEAAADRAASASAPAAAPGPAHDHRPDPGLDTEAGSAAAPPADGAATASTAPSART